MADQKQPRTDSNLKVAFQTFAAAACCLVGESPQLGLNAGAHLYDSLKAKQSPFVKFAK